MTSNKNKTTKKVGRPTKYNTIDLKQVEELAKYGLIDTQIATILKISEATLNNYKDKPEFLESLKRGRLVADNEVVKSLYKRATGYDYEEITEEYDQEKKGKVLKSVKVAKKHKAPDVTAQIIWLKNRDKNSWSDMKSLVNIDNSKKVTQVYYEWAGKHKKSDDSLRTSRIPSGYSQLPEKVSSDGSGKKGR